MNSNRTKSIILDLAIKHKLSIEQVKLICRSPFDATAKIMSTMEFPENIKDTKCNINLMYFGKFYITDTTLLNKQKRILLKKQQDAERLHTKDEADEVR